jgi:hypothetical protein
MPCATASIKNPFTMSKRGQIPRIRPKPEFLVFISGVFRRPPRSSRGAAQTWWSQSGSNRRPQACKASAIPTELWPRPNVPNVRTGHGPCREWWAEEELNLRPHAYQACALTT